MSLTVQARLNTAGPLSDYLSERDGTVSDYPVLEQDADTDVVVVGAGYTGLSCALSLAERGISVCLLEAKEPGFGASGRAWGQVAAAAKFMPARVEQDFPPAIADRINRAAETASDVVFDLIRKYDIHCDAVRTGNIIAAHTPHKARWVTETAKDLQARGYPVHLLDPRQTSAMTGSNRYQCALWDERGGALNPLAYARGLARAAVSAGVRIYAHSPVERLERNRDQWRLYTPSGTADARQVVFATGAFTGDIAGTQTGKEIIPVRAYQAVSAPLTESVRRSILPGNQPLNDTRRMFSGVRLWPDGRLHVGTDGPLFRQYAEGWLQGATRRLTLMFPQLTDLEWEYQWAGWVDMTADHYPRLHRNAAGLFSACGFSGRGVAIGTLMGRDLASLVAEGSHAETVHPVTDVKPMWYHGIHRPLVKSLSTAYRLEDYFNDRRYGGRPALRHV